VDPGDHPRTTAWNALKRNPGSPTLTHLKALIAHHEWLAAQRPAATLPAAVPPSKLRQLAAEAQSLDAARMQELEPQRRYTLAAALLHGQAARALDELGQMLAKHMTRIHHRGKEALATHQLQHQDRMDGPVRTLYEVVTAYCTGGGAAQRFAAIEAVLASRHVEVLAQCEAHAAHAGRNYSPFLWRFYAPYRPTLVPI
jgi:hypothetical protein